MTYKELVEELKTLLVNINSLPDKAMSQPISHYDFASVLQILVEILEKRDETS